METLDQAILNHPDDRSTLSRVCERAVKLPYLARLSVWPFAGFLFLSPKMEVCKDPVNRMTVLMGISERTNVFMDSGDENS